MYYPESESRAEKKIQENVYPCMCVMNINLHVEARVHRAIRKMDEGKRG